MVLGQFLSLCLCGTGVTSELLVTDYDISVPTTQCFFNYLLLALTFGVYFATKKRSSLFHCVCVCVCVCGMYMCECGICIYIQSCDSELENQGLSHVNHVTGMCVCMYSTVLCTLLYNIADEVCKLLQLVDFT